MVTEKIKVRITESGRIGNSNALLPEARWYPQAESRGIAWCRSARRAAQTGFVAR